LAHRIDMHRNDAVHVSKAGIDGISEYEGLGFDIDEVHQCQFG